MEHIGAYKVQKGDPVHCIDHNSFSRGIMISFDHFGSHVATNKLNFVFGVHFFR